MGGSIPGKGRSAFIHSAVGQIQSVWVKHHCNTYSLRNSIVPVIVDKDFKLYYYRELEGWEHERGFLRFDNEGAFMTMRSPRSTLA
jgi:hypothetical protein